MDGQWSGIVFRDERMRPLTLFELPRDSWLKFAKMSKENILLFLHNLSYVSYDDKEMCSRININYFASHRYGNIEVHIVPHRSSRGIVVRQILMHSYCGKYNQGSVLHLLKTPLRSQRPDLWQQHLGVQHNFLQVLGILPPGTTVWSTGSGDEHDSDEESSMEDEHLLNIRSDMVDESGRSPALSTATPLICATANNIRNVLLGSHKSMMEDILIALLCSENSVKWSKYNCTEFYEFALSSTRAIYWSMTVHDLDIVINVIRKWECAECPLANKTEFL